jgi:hypothetical protein
MIIYSTVGVNRGLRSRLADRKLLSQLRAVGWWNNRLSGRAGNSHIHRDWRLINVGTTEGYICASRVISRGTILTQACDCLSFQKSV